jgi:hypothetical protein
MNLKPDSAGGSAPFVRTNLDRVETPETNHEYEAPAG